MKSVLFAALAVGALLPGLAEAGGFKQNVAVVNGGGVNVKTRTNVFGGSVTKIRSAPPFRSKPQVNVRVNNGFRRRAAATNVNIRSGRDVALLKNNTAVFLSTPNHVVGSADLIRAIHFPEFRRSSSSAAIFLQNDPTFVRRFAAQSLNDAAILNSRSLFFSNGFIPFSNGCH